jgi:hypothetical protein
MERQERQRPRGSADYLALADEVMDRLGLGKTNRRATDSHVAA